MLGYIAGHFSALAFLLISFAGFLFTVSTSWRSRKNASVKLGADLVTHYMRKPMIGITGLILLALANCIGFFISHWLSSQLGPVVGYMYIAMLFAHSVYIVYAMFRRLPRDFEPHAAIQKHFHSQFC